MKTSTEGFQQSYNAQTVVDDAHQIVVDASVSACASDQGQLIARLDAVEEHLGEQPEEVLADAGYCNEADLRELEERGIAGYVALGREGKKQAAVDPKTRPGPASRPPVQKQKDSTRPATIATRAPPSGTPTGNRTPPRPPGSARRALRRRSPRVSP